MQYSLPQFVEVEDKIIGPLTLKQFLILLGGGLLCFVYWSVFKLNIYFFVAALPTMVVFAIVAFARFNGRKLMSNFPFLLHFFLIPRQRIFKRMVLPPPAKKRSVEKPAPSEVLREPEKMRSRLQELAYVLDQKSAEEERLIHSKELPKKWLNEI